MALDLTALEYALAVRDQGSFRRAASVLRIEPSAISRRVRALEDSLGVGLFQRRTQGALPTSAGRRVLDQAAEILASIHFLERTASSRGTGQNGSLCIGVVSSIAGGTARELLRDFVAGYPEVELLVTEGSPRDHIAQVRDLQMDLTFVVNTPNAPGCTVEPLWEEAILVALSVRHSLAKEEAIHWSQLDEERFIVSRVDPGPEIHDFVVRKLSALGRHPLVEPRPLQREGLMAMVGLDQGISLVGAAEAAIGYPDVVFRPLVGEMLPFSAVLSDRNDNPALRRFMSLARQRVKALARRPAADAASRTHGPSP